jgi:hypothetical protein
MGLQESYRASNARLPSDCDDAFLSRPRRAPIIFALEENDGTMQKLQVHPGQKSTNLATHHGRLATAYRATEQDLHDLVLKTWAEGQGRF